jgi:hypothetical protein
MPPTATNQEAGQAITLCIVFRKCSLQISAKRLAILTEVMVIFTSPFQKMPGHNLDFTTMFYNLPNSMSISYSIV